MNNNKTQNMQSMQDIEQALQQVNPINRINQITPLNVQPKNEAQAVYQQIANYGKEKIRQNWSDIDQIANACSSAFDIISEIRGTYLVTALHHFLPDRQLAAVTLKTLAQDATTFIKDLQEIRKLHTDKSGDISDDDLVDSIRIFELYVVYSNRFNQIIIPNATILAEEAQKAVSAMRLHLAELEAQEAATTDPTVITDVVVKTAD